MSQRLTRERAVSSQGRDKLLDRASKEPPRREQGNIKRDKESTGKLRTFKEGEQGWDREGELFW